MTARRDSAARARLHQRLCPSVGACRFVGGASETGTLGCQFLDELVDAVERDHARALAAVILDEIRLRGLAADGGAGHYRTAAALIDPDALPRQVPGARLFTPPRPAPGGGGPVPPPRPPRGARGHPEGDR